jgi:type IV secretory pathway TraG/TraD family ATPase VirD4
MYPQSYKAILDNCGVKQWFDLNLDDSELVSAVCGEREVVRRTKSVNWSPLYNYEKPSNVDLQNLHVTNNNATERVPLIRPHELRNNLGPEGQVLSISNVPKPVRANHRPFFKFAALRRLAQPNPFIARKQGKRRIVLPPNDNWKKLLKE